MKKLFTLFLIAICAMTATAQEPLYTIKSTLAADPEWGDDYAPYFAFQGTEVTIDVYADDYIIIRDWAGAKGCDLKLEYDPSIDIDSDDCMGNIIAVTSYINGVEQTPLSYEKTEVDEESGESYTYTYFDFATGREDYPVCSSTLNDDGTLYWSFIELDHEAQSGYAELSFLYFMTADYSANMDEQYYYAAWGDDEKEPTGFGTFLAHVDEYVYSYEDEETGEEVIDTETFGTALLKGFDVKVDVRDGYVRIYDWSNNPASPRDLIVTCPNDDDNTVTGITCINTATGNETDATNGAYVYTGYNKADYTEPYAYNIYPYAHYSYAGWDEESGYVLIVGYTYTMDPETGKTATSAWGHYYVEWETADGIAAPVIRTTRNPHFYNLSGQRVTPATRGILIHNGKKFVR